jgi:hypothetical protein
VHFPPHFEKEKRKRQAQEMWRVSHARHGKEKAAAAAPVRRLHANLLASSRPQHTRWKRESRKVPAFRQRSEKEKTPFRSAPGTFVIWRMRGVQLAAPLG